MTNQATVLRIGENVEEEVLLQIEEVRLTCFANVCPYPLNEGQNYPVSLTMMIFDDYEVGEVSEQERPSIVQIGTSFQHLITGRLNGIYLKSEGLVFEDETLLRDFSFLDGKLVTVKVDRIDAEFL